MTFLTIRVEPWSALTEEDRLLCVEHWEEIAPHKATIPLAPAWDRYAKMAEAGVVHLTTARDGTRLVGYAVYFTVPHIHYASSLTAFADVLFMRPEFRHGATILRLLKVAETSLRGMGVQRVIQNVKVNKDWGVILTRQGYQHFENVYQKLLG